MAIRQWSLSMGEWPKHFKGTIVGGLLITQLDTNDLIGMIEETDRRGRHVNVEYESDNYGDEVCIRLRYCRTGKTVIVCNLQLESYKP